MKTGLILFSHGSVLCGAGETLYEHAERLRVRGEYACVEVGFLNYTLPTLSEATEKCLQAGVEHIIIVPYFLVPGKFVTVDLPEQMEAVKSQYPTLQFAIAEALGFHETLADAILQLASRASSSPKDWQENLRRASEYCKADARCPLYGTLNCPCVPSLAVTA